MNKQTASRMTGKTARRTGARTKILTGE